jgi:hypothetical protein
MTASPRRVAVRHRRLRLFLAAGCSCLLTLSVAGCESASNRVEINVQSLVSDARDGSMLAGQIVAGRAGATFARTHAQELQDDADQIEKNVYDQRLPGHEAIEQLADQISTALGNISVRPDDPSVARQAQSTLDMLGEKASRMTS